MRNNQGASSEQVAQKLEYESVVALQTQFENWGLPGWVLEEAPNSKRRAQGGKDEGRELPATSEAAEDFKITIDRLSGALDHLPFMKQWLKDGRFVTELVYTEEDGVVNLLYTKADFPDPGGKVGAFRWKRVCEEHGQNPEVEEFKVPIDWVQPGGAAWHPHDFLTWLVGAHALAGQSLENLLEKLHPEPQAGDEEVAEKKRAELVHKARQLAAFVRGSRRAVTQGPKREAVPPQDQGFAWMSASSLRAIGISEEEIDRLIGLRLPHTKHNP